MASTSNGDRFESSDEEPERSVELNESKRVRRRRGRRTRKKSDRDSPSSEANRSPEPLQHRKRTCSLGAPPAPRNTNDFLLEDMEKREEDGAKRLRREQQLENDDASPHSERGDEEELPGEDEFEDQYEESWQECVVDKYKEMPHDELARRMAIMEKNRDEVERKLRWERSKSDYLQERLLEAEEQIRGSQDEVVDDDDLSPSTPPPPVPSSMSSSCILPLFPTHHGSCSPFNQQGNCSPNVISSPRA